LSPSASLPTAFRRALARRRLQPSSSEEQLIWRLMRRKWPLGLDIGGCGLRALRPGQTVCGGPMHIAHFSLWTVCTLQCAMDTLQCKQRAQSSAQSSLQTSARSPRGSRSASWPPPPTGKLAHAAPWKERPNGQQLAAPSPPSSSAAARSERLSDKQASRWASGSLGGVEQIGLCVQMESKWCPGGGHCVLVCGTRLSGRPFELQSGSLAHWLTSSFTRWTQTARSPTD